MKDFKYHNYPSHLGTIYQSDIYPVKKNMLQPPYNVYHYINAETIDDVMQYGYMYIIKNNDTNLYKIGTTFLVRNRFKQLQTQTGCQLELIFLFAFENLYDENCKIAESYFHKYFKDKRKNGEWFDLSARDLVKIRAWSLLCDIEYWYKKDCNVFIDRPDQRTKKYKSINTY